MGVRRRITTGANPVKSNVRISRLPIFSMMQGFSSVENFWTVFVPNCEPFCGVTQLIPDAVVVPTANRGVFLAYESQAPSVVFVPNRQLPSVLLGLSSYANVLSSPLVLIVEDHPFIAPLIMPRQLLSEAGLTTLEPCNAIESEFVGIATAQISAASKKPVAVITHHGLLGAASSVNEMPTQELPAARLHGETKDPIRLSRRLELNRQRTLPSPGERGSVGFITVGLADNSLRYLVSELRLLGRVPTLNLRLISPLDDVPIKRLLTRCHNLVVLEPRPGEIEERIMAIAEQMRRDGEEVALVWGRELPSIDPEHAPVQVPVDAIHPSVVARMIKHLLHEARPASEVEHHLLQSKPPLQQRPERRAHLGTIAALQVLSNAAKIVASDCEMSEVTIDGALVRSGEGEKVFIETWGRSRFQTDGLAVVKSLIGVDETRIFLVWEGGSNDVATSFLDASILPSTKDDKSRVVRVGVDHHEELIEAITAAIARSGVSIIVVREGNEPRFDIDRLSEVCKAIDSRGFLETNIISIPVEEMSEVHRAPSSKKKTSSSPMPLETRIWSDWLTNGENKFHISLTPVMEQAKVVRVKPPIRVVSHTDARLTPPKPVHANSPEWRVHIAGTRGDELGIIAQILLRGAETMGYETRTQSNSVFVGAGRRAWTQILFTQPQTARSERPLVGFIPWGEADLLLGWDREEVMRAVDPEGILQIASPQRTFAIINTGKLDLQLGLGKKQSDEVLDLDVISQHFNDDAGMIGDFSAWARYRFHNTRLGDIVQLGVAFQQGLIPCTVDAMNSSLQEAERRGFARSQEAFEYGRRIALHPDVAWVPVDEETVIDLTRITRRYIRNIRRIGFRGKKRAEIAKRLFDRALRELPGLSETLDGRNALYSAIVGIRRCMLWGGETVATNYVDLVVGVYKKDRVETGRALTRYCILILAESMLIRDPIYLARLARSPEIIRNLRSRLNIRKPRGDELHRRFLSRVELCIGKWRLNAEIRSSDWSAALISNVGRFYPRRLRGRKRDREVRKLLMQLMSQVAHEQAGGSDRLHFFEQLHAMAVDGSLHTVSFREMKCIVSQESEISSS
jgi:hypothetical protein